VLSAIRPKNGSWMGRFHQTGEPEEHEKPNLKHIASRPKKRSIAVIRFIVPAHSDAPCVVIPTVAWFGLFRQRRLVQLARAMRMAGNIFTASAWVIRDFWRPSSIRE
jgi:hypothetical protein